MYDLYSPEMYQRDRGEGNLGVEGEADAAGAGGWSRTRRAVGSVSSAARSDTRRVGARAEGALSEAGGAASSTVRARSPRSRYTRLASLCPPPGTVPEETGAPMASSTADSTGGLETQAASRTASECIDLTHDDDDHITIESDD